MAVGTAAAAKATVISNQYQCVDACGPCAKVCANEFAGAAVIKDKSWCKTTTVAIAGGAQEASASTLCGPASINQGQCIYAAVCV